MEHIYFESPFFISQGTRMGAEWATVHKHKTPSFMEFFALVEKLNITQVIELWSGMLCDCIVGGM